MVKGSYQLPHNHMELIHLHNRWSTNLEFINNGFSYNRAHELYHKGIQSVANIWDSEHHTFLSWDKAQVRFSLTPMEVKDWIMLTTKSLANWRHVLEDDLDVTHTGQWVGLYREGTEDPVFVYKCSANCTPSCMHAPTPPVHATPFQMLHGGHSTPNILVDGKTPPKTCGGFFHKVKIIRTTGGGK